MSSEPRSPLVPRPALDGVDHINVYSKARTEVGRWMSNFTGEVPMLPLGADGNFTSVEGYWFWLLTGHEELRHVSGWEAKHLGAQVRGNGRGQFRSSDESGFRAKIEAAIVARAARRPDMVATLQSEKYKDLPLDHYYVDRNNRPIAAGHRWVLDVWDKIRSGVA